MNTDYSARAWLEAFALLPDDRIHLAEAALWIAAEEQPGLDPAPSLQRLAELGDWMQERLHGVSLDIERLALLSRFLGDELGFRANREEYYEPENSFLDQVLNRGKGVPITLSLVYLEVGRRAGIPLSGVCFPGHFLVRHAHQSHLVLDPYEGGRLLTRGDCSDLLERTGSKAMFDDALLKPASNRQILIRLLNNLRNVYLHSGELLRAMSVLDRILLFDPTELRALRDRGLLKLQIGEAEAGLGDLEAYLDLVPDAPDQQGLLAVMEQTQRRGIAIH